MRCARGVRQESARSSQGSGDISQWPAPHRDEAERSLAAQCGAHRAERGKLAHDRDRSGGPQGPKAISTFPVELSGQGEVVCGVMGGDVDSSYSHPPDPAAADSGLPRNRQGFDSSAHGDGPTTEGPASPTQGFEAKPQGSPSPTPKPHSPRLP